MRPFRFGVIPSTVRRLPLEWIPAVKRFEALGYSTVFQCDHFNTKDYDPIAMLASAASVTKTLNIGTFVFAVDYRHPVILAKAAATLHLLSGGRFEFGIGAGYQPYDYNMAGIPLDSAGKRVERLEEALKIIKGMWTQERMSFSGKHYQVTDIEKAGELPEGEHPKIMIGGGGRKMLRLAAQYAGIVNIIPRWRGSWGKGIQDQTLDGIKDKIELVKTAAVEFGREPEDIEFQLYLVWNDLSDKPEPIRENIAKTFNISVEDVENSIYVMVGSSKDIIKKIRTLNRETGVNYFVFDLRGGQFEEYAESIIKPLIQ